MRTGLPTVAALLLLAGSAHAGEIQMDVVADDGVRLAGTLTLPNGPGPYPAALLVAGFGPHDRDGRYQASVYAQWADALAERGVALLRYDKRGIGSSGGKALAWLDPSVLERDAANAVAALARRPEIDPTRLAVIGHSQGGDIALAAARQVPEVDRAVTLAAPARPLSAYRRGTVELVRRLAGENAARAIAEADPRADARSLPTPVLIVHGQGDRTVPVSDAKLLRAARRGSDQRTVVAILPRLGHQLVGPDGLLPPGLVARVARFVSRGT